MARRIVFLCLALLFVICLGAIGSMRFQSNQVDYLTLTLSPVIDANTDIFRDMSLAQTELLQYQASNDSKHLVLFRAAKVHIEVVLVRFRDQVFAPAHHFDKDVESRLLYLEPIQLEAAERWLAYSLVIEQAVSRGETSPLLTEVQLFEGFRRANSALNDLLENETIDARSEARSALDKGTVLVIASALTTSLVMVVFGLRLARSISRPIVNLRRTMNRQFAGDIEVRANEEDGSSDTRSLAHDFNVLIQHQIDLQQIQARALEMHELAAKIGIAIRNSSSIVQSLEFICRALGEGLGVDRVMANTMDADHKPSLVAQWHLPDLPPLGNLPDEAIPHVGQVASALWQSSGHIVSDDLVVPEAQTERIQLFHRYTNARAVIVVPIGLGNQVIGMIYVVTVNESRQWSESEVDAVERVAELLAHAIVEDTYRTQQSEHIEILTRLDRQKVNFVATVSHELRTPLTSIIGYLEVLKDGYAGVLIGEQSRLVEVIDRNASRLLALINDLLTLSRSEHGGPTNDVADVLISELITESCQELPPIVHSDAVKLEINAGPMGAIVRGDREQLKRVIVNIISNAIKFSRPGGVVTITSTIDDETNRIRINVEDRGIGIPQAEQKELFTRFYRGSNATARFIPGTGLGLSIVKQIVNDHGGEVRLTSVEGKGTKVTIDLPLALTKVDHNPK